MHRVPHRSSSQAGSVVCPIVIPMNGVVVGGVAGVGLDRKGRGAGQAQDQQRQFLPILSSFQESGQLAGIAGIAATNDDVSGDQYPKLEAGSAVGNIRING